MGAETLEAGASKTVGAIDIGSNELRLVIAEVYPDGRTDVIERARRAVRLGHDTFLTGRLSQESINAAVQVLRDYRRMLDTYRVTTVRAVATSAVREATNADSFLDRVSRTLDLDIEVIETTEQSRLMLEAVRHDVGEAVDWKSCVAMVAEVGGGSTLLTVVQHGEIGASQGYNLGSIRMQEILTTAHEPPLRAAEMLRHHIGSTVGLARRALDLQDVDTFVAIGGDARFAAHQVGDQMGETALHTVTAGQLDQPDQPLRPAHPRGPGPQVRHGLRGRRDAGARPAGLPRPARRGQHGLDDRLRRLHARGAGAGPAALHHRRAGPLPGRQHRAVRAHHRGEVPSMTSSTASTWPTWPCSSSTRCRRSTACRRATACCCRWPGCCTRWAASSATARTTSTATT